jgi:hypothetical protein
VRKKIKGAQKRNTKKVKQSKTEKITNRTKTGIRNSERIRDSKDKDDETFTDFRSELYNRYELETLNRLCCSDWHNLCTTKTTNRTSF